MIQNAWILTFDRPKALNRQIYYFGKNGISVNVFSNHPDVKIEERNKPFVKQIIVNNLSHEQSNSYCARSWNNIFIKCFIDKNVDEAIFCQDDTLIRDDEYINLINNYKNNFDLIWGPLGDTVFYLNRNLLKIVGWFDERYLGCYCGDCDFLKRCYTLYDKNRLSIEEHHDWGFVLNPIGVSRYVDISMHSRRIDNNYENQHDNLIRNYGDSILIHSQSHFKAKWQTPGNGINGIGSIIYYNNPQAISDIDWYPWFTKKFL